MEDILERRLARALSAGTWLGTAVVALGLIISAWSRTGSKVELAGAAIFVLLPVARVGLMATFFLRRREYLFALLAGFVLAIIACGTALAYITRVAA